MNVVPALSEEKVVAPARSQVVDIVKGIGIILVVFGHTLQGLIHRDWWADDTARTTDTFIYTFHMPAFFIVAGLFLFPSLDKRGLRAFTVDKAKNVLYPYVLWVCIGAAGAAVLGPLQPTARPFGVRSFFVDLLDGSPLWFLYTLFLLQMLAALTRPLAPWLRLALGLLMAVCVTNFGRPMPDRILQEFVFLAVGLWIGGRVSLLDGVNRLRTLVGFVALAAFQFIAVRRSGGTAVVESVLLGVTGSAGLFLLSRLLDGTTLGRAFAWVGQASLAVFFLSPYGQGFFREVVSRVLHTQAAFPQLLVPTVGAVLIPAFLWHVQDRLRIGWLFRFPTRRPTPTSSPP